MVVINRYLLSWLKSGYIFLTSWQKIVCKKFYFMCAIIHKGKKRYRHMQSYVFCSKI